MREYYAILIDGEPYLDRNYVAIRTYKTRERAEKEARNLLELDRKYEQRRRVSRYEVGTFALSNLTEVGV